MNVFYLLRISCAALLLITHSLVAQPLRLLSRTPEANAVAAPVATSVRLNFSEAMSPQTATVTAIQVVSAWRGLLAGTYTGAGTASITFTPSRHLLAGELVQVTVTTSATSLTGAALPEPVTFRFTAATSGGTGHFLDEDVALKQHPLYIAVGDINKDGNLDFVTSNGGTLAPFKCA
jgi:hypothetical protein